MVVNDSCRRQPLERRVLDSRIGPLVLICRGVLVWLGSLPVNRVVFDTFWLASLVMAVAETVPDVGRHALPQVAVICDAMHTAFYS